MHSIVNVSVPILALAFSERRSTSISKDPRRSGTTPASECTSIFELFGRCLLFPHLNGYCIVLRWNSAAILTNWMLSRRCCWRFAANYQLVYNGAANSDLLLLAGLVSFGSAAWKVVSFRKLLVWAVYARHAGIPEQVTGTPHHITTSAALIFVSIHTLIVRLNSSSQSGVSVSETAQLLQEWQESVTWRSCQSGDTTPHWQSKLCLRVIRNNYSTRLGCWMLTLDALRRSKLIRSKTKHCCCQGNVCTCLC